MRRAAVPLHRLYTDAIGIYTSFTRRAVHSSRSESEGQLHGVPMNESDLRALGWVVTRDAFWEVARTLAGRTPRLPFKAMQGLAERWQALQAVVAKTPAPTLSRIVSSSLMRPMSAETCTAAADYLT